MRDVRRTAQNAVNERCETVTEERACRVEAFVARHTLTREECDELRVAERVRTVTDGDARLVVRPARDGVLRHAAR